MNKLALILCGCCAAFAIGGTARAQTITNQPQSITVNNASTAEFTVGAAGVTNYQWQFESNNLSDGGNISGSSTATLTIEDVNSNQMGDYSVVLNGTTNSANATLTVTNGTIITFQFTGFPDGGTSNMDVQLFDHDKPATVQNFLHYITSGAYSNMFIHRDDNETGLNVIQGGMYGASNRTDSAPPITAWTIPNFQTNPPFPPQLNNEFNTGPLIHNRFGTLAMARGSGLDSATAGFFFNTGDNSANLDPQSFVVFGRILDGTNTLDYFTGLTNGEGIFPDAAILDDGDLTTNIYPMPVNYIGNAAPANSNLVFCDFLHTNTPLDTNPPGIVITSPSPGVVLTNANPVIQGIASDDVGLADIMCVLTPLAGPDGTFPNLDLAITNFANGTTNWSVTIGDVETIDILGGLTLTDPVPPGVYDLIAQAQDGAGNLSPVASLILTNSAVVIAGDGIVTYSNYNAVGFPFTNTGDYELVATPDTNQIFVSWTGANLVSFAPTLPFVMASGSVVTATFISNGLPNSLAFTYPAPNGNVSNNTFDITGTISNVPSPPVTVVCQIVSLATSNTIGPLLTNIGTTNFIMTVTNLPFGFYAVEATAVDSASNSTIISEDFEAQTNATLQLDVTGPGTVSGATNGEMILTGSTFVVTATPDGGDLFYNWTDGTNVSLNPTQTNTMTVGLTLAATFYSNTLPNSITFSAPATNTLLSNNTVQVSGTISNAPAPPVTLTCQIFSPVTLSAVTTAQTTSGTTAWSFTMGDLTAGNYIAQVLAVDQAGNSTIITKDFTASLDTNLPFVSIAAPTTLLTANNPVIVSGAASDSVVQVTAVECFLLPQAAPGGTLPEIGPYAYENATGTSNWSANFGLLPPGIYTNLPEALDSVGNIGVATNLITNTAILINGGGSVSLMQGSNQLPFAVGYPLQYNETYKAVAIPAAGQKFVEWTEGAATASNPTQTFVMNPGLLLTATFVPTNTEKGLSFTYPAANAKLGTNNFTMKGRMTSAFTSARVSCRITSLTTGYTLGPFTAASGTTSWSLALSNVPPDNYVVVAEATNGSGGDSTISEKFSILAFVHAAGTYSGLFISTNTPVASTNSGLISFTLGSTGIFTGKLVFPAYAPVPIYPIAFQNDYFTTGEAQFELGNFHGNGWVGYIDVDLSGSNDFATGQFMGTGWSAQVICYRAAAKLSGTTTPATGKFTLSLQPGDTNLLGANGYATVNVTAGGVVNAAGALPDSTAFSESTRISREGIWPLFAVPGGDGARGVVLGWVTNQAAGDCAGQVFWYKGAHVGAYFTSGVGVSNDVPLAAGGTNLSLPVVGSAFAILFNGQGMAPMTNFLQVNNAGKFVVTGGSDNKLKISLSANGVITGTVVNLNNDKTAPFKGVFLGPAQGGSGFVPGTGGQTAAFQIVPQ